jgi:hypothetical protein
MDSGRLGFRIRPGSWRSKEFTGISNSRFKTDRRPFGNDPIGHAVDNPPRSRGPVERIVSADKLPQFRRTLAFVCSYRDSSCVSAPKQLLPKDYFDPSLRKISIFPTESRQVRFEFRADSSTSDSRVSRNSVSFYFQRFTDIESPQPHPPLLLFSSDEPERASNSTPPQQAHDASHQF